jgi:hypothetical protein
VIGLGKALGMDVLAEGVETAEQLGILESEGCGQMQGYLFNKPRPVQDVQGIIAADLTAKAKWPLGPTLVQTIWQRPNRRPDAISRPQAPAVALGGPARPVSLRRV